MISRPELSSNLADLRRVFDNSFSRPLAHAEVVGKEYLLIRAGGRFYALPLGELAGMARMKRLVPLPGQDPGFMGLMGRRGTVVPVFDLVRILHEANSIESDLKWVVFYGERQPTGLAFNELQGHIRIPEDRLHAPEKTLREKSAARAAFQTDAAAGIVLDLARITEMTKIGMPGTPAGGKNDGTKLDV